MPYGSLKDFFRNLKPIESSESVNGQKSTDRKTLRSILTELLMSPGGVFVPYEEIVDRVNEHFLGKDNVPDDEKNLRLEEKKKAGILFHGIGSSPDKRFQLEDDVYWGDVKSTNSFVKDLRKDFSYSVFSIKNPYVSPSLRGTEQIEFFLNYMPAIMVSQMVPHFDVEFHISRPIVPDKPNAFMDTPSIMRFLMGSTELSNLSPAEKAIVSDGQYNEKKGSDNFAVKVSGMEMFLMPQTLTNMNSLTEKGLGSEAARLVPVRPFVPFASIEGFDVTIQNAGAGAFAHKKANLKMKIHDKSRLGEMSEFFRGEVGFSQAVIWTTYGWLAPRGNTDLNEYAKFINENMLIRECWKVMNSQFSFDQAGQVSVSLELVSAAAKETQGVTICELQAGLDTFHKVIKTIAEIKRKLTSSSENFTLPATAEQVLNSASTNGIFKDIDKMDDAVKDLIVNAKQSGNLSEEQIEALQEGIQSLRGDNSYENFVKSVTNFVKKKFDELARSPSSPDPFLPVDSKKDFYPGPRSSALISEIQSFIDTPSRRNAVVQESKDKGPKEKAKNVTEKLNLVADVVSFGKLFSTFVVPSIAETHTVDELQVFFYAMNDSCGPMSGLSIAEFPIDVTEIAYSYNESLKLGAVDGLGLEAFLRLAIETQFSAKTSIAYGMNRFYKLKEENGKRTREIDPKDQGAKDGMEKWVDQYGVLKLPVIEMYIESGEQGAKGKDIIGNLKKTAYRTKEGKTAEPNLGGDRKRIMRIHIYDRTNNPFSLAQKVINTGSGFEVGDIDNSKLKGYFKALKEAVGQQKFEEFGEFLKNIKSGTNVNEGLAAAAKSANIPSDSLPKIDFIDQPGYSKVEMQSLKNRKDFKSFLTSTVPTIKIGTNGSLVFSVNVASKTDGTMGAINLIKAKSNSPGKAGLTDNGLEEANGLPLRVVPVQVTMTTMGVPTAQLYQTYFIDFDTGTTIDNIYNCTQIQHSISQGKFTTSWTYVYTDGYGKFGAPKSILEIASDQYKAVIRETNVAKGLGVKPGKKK